MNNSFIDLDDIAALDRFLTRSQAAPLVIFKHSETCGISARAYGEMLKLIERSLSAGGEDPIAKIPIGIVAVQVARDVSNEIAHRTGIEHESPQVFVLLNGKVAWTASHGAVRAEAVRAAMTAAVASISGQ